MSFLVELFDRDGAKRDWVKEAQFPIDPKNNCTADEKPQGNERTKEQTHEPTSERNAKFKKAAAIRCREFPRLVGSSAAGQRRVQQARIKLERIKDV
jgi:hypothetical protein